LDSINIPGVSETRCDAFEEIANRLEDDDAILEWVQKNGARHSAEAVEQWNSHDFAASDTAAKKARSSIFSEAGGEVARIFGLIRSDRV